jgi:hypothetical protein
MSGPSRVAFDWILLPLCQISGGEAGCPEVDVAPVVRVAYAVTAAELRAALAATTNVPTGTGDCLF